ncbi:MAG TPA: phosphoribosyltransferase [Actinoplanes sp.]|nr:phosphoribosyltransferase [Actinoplanes sp.]
MDLSLRDRLRAAFRWTDPGPDSRHLVSDRSGWWRDAALLAALGPALADLFRAEAPSVVVAPEVTGFLLGPLVARSLSVGFVEGLRHGVRRPIAEAMTWADVAADHRGEPQRLGVRSRLISPADRVLVVDDWVATGAQARALFAVITALGATPIGTATVVADCPDAVRAELHVRSILTGADLPPTGSSPGSIPPIPAPQGCGIALAASTGQRELVIGSYACGS